MSGRACDVGVCVWGEAMKACVRCGGVNGEYIHSRIHTCTDVEHECKCGYASKRKSTCRDAQILMGTTST